MDGGELMAVRRPVVRHFIACERVERSSDGRHDSLINLIHSLRPLPGASFPRIHSELWLYAVLADGRGELSFCVEVVTWEGTEEQSIHTTPTVRMDLGQSPLVVHGWPVRLRNLPLPHPGLYEFRLVCEGEVVAREPIAVREQS
jgi:hypothetical protein